MFLTGEPVSAEELARFGGIREVAPAGELRTRALATAALMTRHSPLALRYGKRTLNLIEAMDLKAGYEYEQSMTREMTRFADSKEAVQAFLERRPPRYTGS